MLMREPYSRVIPLFLGEQVPESKAELSPVSYSRVPNRRVDPECPNRRPFRVVPVAFSQFHGLVKGTNN